MIIDDVAQSIRRIAYAIPNLKYLPEDHNTSIVKDDITEKVVWWGDINIPFCPIKFELL